MPGIAIEIITLLTNYLNLTIDIKKVRSYQLDYNSYTFDELDNNETDVFALTFGNTSTRAKKFDFTKELFSVCCSYSYLTTYSRRILKYLSGGQTIH
jgi:hypothetical protein